MYSIELIKGLLEKHFSNKIELNPMKGGINNEVSLCNTDDNFKKMFVVKIFSKEKVQGKRKNESRDYFFKLCLSKIGH